MYVDDFNYVDDFYDWYISLPKDMRATVDDIADAEGLPYYDECSEEQLLWLMEQIQAQLH